MLRLEGWFLDGLAALPEALYRESLVTTVEIKKAPLDFQRETLALSSRTSQHAMDVKALYQGRWAQ